MTPLLLIAWLVAHAGAPAQPASSPLPLQKPVEIVVFSDFQCPYCAQFSRVFRELQTKGVAGVDTTFTFRHFPLSIHPLARLAHQAALAAAEQGKFWQMHDLLFADQQHAQREDLLGYARQLNLDLPRFVEDLDSERIKRVIDADVAEGDRRRVDGTPTFYVNGRPFVGTQSVQQLKAAVEGEFHRAAIVNEIRDEFLSKGPSAAPITIELFADLQSPVSRPAVALLDDVLRRYPSTVRLQFRSFPLAFHPQAPLAHEAAMIAARQGRFWEFVAYALDHQDSLREQDLIALAGRLGLESSAFAEALRSHRYAPRVDADMRAGLSKGVRGSPVILVNGRRIDGVPSLETLIEYVEAALTSQHANPLH